MRSTAQFQGHPIHPMLIPFPFAFLTGAFAFDLLGVLMDDVAWWTTGGHLAAAGILTALLAAIPGFIDYLYTVPPRSSGKRRATYHMAANLSAVALMVLAWTIRGGEPTRAPGPFNLGLEFLSVALLSAGSYMGGTLAYRNQIGIDHRYARAGKWRDTTVKAAGGAPVAVASNDELEVDQMKLVRAGGRRIVVGRTGEGFAAFDDACTHRGGSLAGGTMICGTVQCPWHGSQFDVKTGDVKAGPAKQRIGVYEVVDEKTVVKVRLP
jgi:uncharacterized membrane protein/nitrite reductase/ring-hydroxylating ferredoxin subunit